jgi:RNA polymerase sigma factor (sigma-70 family)
MHADDSARDTRQTVADDQQDERRRDLRSRCDALFREHNEALVRAVYSRLHSWDEATEVVQEAYVRMFRLNDPPPINFLRAYLYKTAFNLAADRRNKAAVRQRDEESVYREVYGQRELDNPSPERVCLDEEVRVCLQNAVNALPAKCRWAYTLVELEDQTVRQAAAQMGIAEMAVYQLVNRAYGHLARALGKRGWHT